MRTTAKDWLDRPMTSWHLILAIFVLLLGFGLLMVLSASSIASFRSPSGSAFSKFENQASYAVVGLAGFVFATRVSPKVIRRLSFPAVLASVGLLAAVLVIGHRYNGAKSWLGVGPVSFQPSELAKVALLLWMGHVLAARRHTLRSLKALLFPVLPIFVIMVGLIMLQPDLGTTVSLGIVFLAVLWFAGAPIWIFALLAAGAGGGVVYLATSVAYRSDRVACWLQPVAASCYQLYQGYYGMGHGGIFGVGLGQSMAKWSWLPNADSDFIFAIIGEELGLIGTGILLLLFGLLAYTGLRIARRNVDPFIKIIAGSCTAWLVGQAAINVGYVVGLLPVTGIPLPMISAGGTSLVVTMLVFGLLANFARREAQAAAALRSQGPGRLARFLGVGVEDPEREAQKEQRRRESRDQRAAARRARQRRDQPPAGAARPGRRRERASAERGQGKPGSPTARSVRGSNPEQRPVRPSRQRSARRAPGPERFPGDRRPARPDPDPRIRRGDGGGRTIRP